MSAAYGRVLKEESENITFKPEVREGLKKAAESFRKIADALFERKAVDLLDAVRKKKMTPMEYALEISKLNALLYA
jgi:hypothetical protein